ncbi:MAG TPA: hypothetical protein VK448_11360 [Dissulfurispiraceae bacterium]|nr:hypothetical protein [Dissulfurispiraceae bacterium]
MNRLNDLIKLSVIIGILLISGSISYYFVYFLPQQEKIKIQAAAEKEADLKLREGERQLDLDACLRLADANYMSLVRANGTGPKYSMPLDLAKTLDKRHNDARDDCYKKHPVVKQ